MTVAGRAPAISPRAERSWAPLSFAQQGLWFLDQWAPGSPRYNVPMAVQIEGPLDVRALTRAVARVAQRHELLRTTFVERGGGPVQLVSAASPVTLRIVDVTAIEPRTRAALVSRLLRRDAWQPFALDRGPLLRVTLWRTAAEAHVLAAVVHHIISDAWSMNLVLREVTIVYAALVANRPAPLAPLPIQYGDYAAWERARLDDPAIERSLSYWVTQLAGVPPLDLPTDRPRPARRTFAGGSEGWGLSRELSARVRALARQERVTLFMLLLAVLVVLIRRYTTEDDVAIGSAMTTRQTRETESLVGLFLNTLVLRMKVDPRQPFQRVLADARTVVVGAMAHRDVPFERVVERLRPARRDDAPLFNVMLALLPPPREEVRIARLRLTDLPVADEAIRYDLTLFAREDGDELKGFLSYSIELFDAATIARMARHFVHLLGAVIDRPSARVEELPLLGAAERGEVLARGTGLVVPHPAAAGVHELFERHVAATPDAAAVVREDDVLSYSDIDRGANQIAHALIALGAGRGTRVALCLDRRPPLVRALLATMKAGACYLPLDPTYPAKRLHRILDDARPSVLLTERRFADLWQDVAGVTVLCLDADDGAIAGRPTTNPRRTITPDDPVYVIYTSGSTGAPKGVIVPHRALVNSCLGVVEATGVGPGDRFLHFAPIGFDVSAFQIFPALIAGATVVLADPASELSNDDILDLCIARALTILDLPSALFQQWVTDIAERRRSLPESLRVFMTGGEPTPMDSVRTWASMVAAPTRFISSYGPTETAVTTMWRGAASDVSSWHTPSVTLGRPLANVTIRVVDEALQPVPVGVPGELCVAGAGLAHGYVDRPDLTAQRFVPDPLGTTAGARLYRTGDRVRYRNDGILEFLGRFDHQLKLHGVRVEAGEIETLLRQHPQVRAAVVAATTRPGGRQLITAHVVPEDPAPSEADLRRHLAAFLPAAVLPSAFCFLPALPMTPNGKIDRRALPVPTFVDAGRVIAAPRTETERLLVEMWTDALGTTGIGVDDDFFALGGHSLAAARLASRLRESFGIEVPVRAVFEEPTIASLAKLIDRRRRAAHVSERLPLAKVARDGPLPLSFAQQGFWLLEQLEPGNPIYVNPEVIRLQGPFSAGAFARALTATVARHEVLRTTFDAAEGAPRQIVGAARPFDVPVVDLERLPPRSREAAATSCARTEARRAFDLARGPLMRATVLRFAADEHIVLFTIHHVVADLWSVGVLTTELSAGYRAALAGRPTSLPDLPLQYADYAVWERRRWQDDVLDAAVARRRAQIGDIAELELPTDRPRGLSPRFVGARQAIPLPEDLVARVREAGRRQGATLFMSLVAVLQTLLHLYTGQDAIAIAVPVANRDEPATEGLIGYFVNHVIVATRFDGNPTWREILARARAATLDALDQQDLPFEEFVRRLRPERRGSHTPLHRVLFNLMNVAGVRLDLPGVGAEVAPPTAVGTTRFDLQWTFVDAGDRASGELEYDRELWDPVTAERMTAHFIGLLHAFVDSPDHRLATLSLMSAAQESLALAFNEPL